MLGGSGMSVAPVTMSLASSFITAIELLGNPAEIYFYGAQFALIGELFDYYDEVCDKIQLN